MDTRSYQVQVQAVETDAEREATVFRELRQLDREIAILFNPRLTKEARALLGLEPGLAYSCEYHALYRQRNAEKLRASNREWMRRHRAAKKSGPGA